jgi:hypothetical protein
MNEKRLPYVARIGRSGIGWKVHIDVYDRWFDIGALGSDHFWLGTRKHVTRRAQKMVSRMNHPAGRSTFLVGEDR